MEFTDSKMKTHKLPAYLPPLLGQVMLRLDD
jgi:hypothetical protein